MSCGGSVTLGPDFLHEEKNRAMLILIATDQNVMPRLNGTMVQAN